MDRAALRMAVRRVAHAQGTAATRAALLHLEDTARAWRESLVDPRVVRNSERTLDAVLRRVTVA